MPSATQLVGIWAATPRFVTLALFFAGHRRQPAAFKLKIQIKLSYKWLTEDSQPSPLRRHSQDWNQNQSSNILENLGSKLIFKSESD